MGGISAPASQLPWILGCIFFTFLPVTVSEVDVVCVPPGQVRELDIRCSDTKEKLHIQSVMLGQVNLFRSRNYDCSQPTSDLEHDCLVPQPDQWWHLSEHCEGINRCRQVVSYPAEDPCSAYRGTSYVRTAYLCVSDEDLSGDILTVINPMLATEQVYQGAQVALRSSGYPAMSRDFADAICVITRRSVGANVHVEVYDIRDGSDLDNGAYCFELQDQTVCSQMGIVPDPFVLSQRETTMTLTIQISSSFRGRFWVVLSALTDDDPPQYGSLKIVCNGGIEVDSGDTGGGGTDTGGDTGGDGGTGTNGGADTNDDDDDADDDDDIDPGEDEGGDTGDTTNNDTGKGTGDTGSDGGQNSIEGQTAASTSKLSRTMITNIIIGVGIVAAIVILVSIIVVLCRKKRGRRGAGDDNDDYEKPVTSGYTSPSYAAKSSSRRRQQQPQQAPVSYGTVIPVGGDFEENELYY